MESSLPASDAMTDDFVPPALPAPAPALVRTRALLSTFFFFWLAIAAYKLAATLHYTLLSPLGSHLMPLWIVGLLIGGESLLQVLLDVPAGRLVDRFGRKRMLGVGLFAFMLAGLLFTRFSLVSYVASIALSVIGWLFLAPGTNAYVLAYAERETSGRFLALRDTFWSIGVVLASVSLPFVLMLVPFSMGLMLAGVFALALLFLMLAPKDRPITHLESVLPAEAYHIKRTYLAETLGALRTLNPASSMLFVYSLAGSVFYGVIWFVVPLVIASEPNQELLGVGLGVFDFAVIVTGFLIGTMVDRGNKRLLVFYGLFLFAVMSMLLGAFLGPLFLLFGFLATTGDETAGLSLWSWLHSLDKSHAYDGAVAGALSLAEDAGYALGPMLAGFLYLLVGPAWTIIAGAVPLVGIWFLYSWFVEIPLVTLSAGLVPRMPMRRRHKT